MSDGSPVFSVVMPAHNAARTIHDAISSVLQQQDGDLELIVVDDGSADETAEVVRSIDDGRIVLLQQPKSGAAAAKNAGLRRARGELCGFIDSDDLWLPDFVGAARARLAEVGDAVLCYTDAWALDDRTGRVAVVSATHWERPPETDVPQPQLLRELLERNFLFTSAVARRWVFDVVGPFREDLSSAIDYEMWLRIAARGYPFVCLPGRHAVYRRNQSGSISANRPARYRSLCRVLEAYADDAALTPDERAAARGQLEASRLELAALEGGLTADAVWRARIRPVALSVKNALLRRERLHRRLPAELTELEPLLRSSSNPSHRSPATEP